MSTPRQNLILASGSLMRRRILTDAGFSYEIIKSDDHAEPAPKPGESAAEYTRRAAVEKGLNVSSKRPDALVLSADQVVEFQGGILRKVSCVEEAVTRLMTLSGQSHALVGGWSLSQNQAILHQDNSVVEIIMHELAEDEIRRYIEREKPLLSVACYYLEALGIRMIREIRGCYLSALGLPLPQINCTLRELGLGL